MKMEEIAPDLFRIKIPLPTIKYLNAYVIRGRDRHLIVDTGLDSTECLEVMKTALDRLEIDLKNADFFITHFHGDHAGLLSRLAEKENRIYFNEPESRLIGSCNFFEHLIAYNRKNGFPNSRLRTMAKSISNNSHDYGWKKSLKIVVEGDRIRVGDRCFICLHTPGHSPGHTCLYEPEEKFLVSGDLLFADVTPGIPCLSDQGNPLKDYFESLDRIKELDVDLVLPGHRKLFRSHRERIEETKSFHFDRFDIIRSILDGGPLNAYQVTSKVVERVRGGSWSQLSDQQKCLEMTQVISQLRYMEREGMILISGSHLDGLLPKIFFEKGI
ncbi:MAG TPA: MBL fold metallo-hydrolase [Desulfobacteraceae bacterium]|nr:MBL fold metallo-hydrolase [Desulfobacteraceae bacterium]HPQ27123.1 MBL fold metallo-hydrolase [Desulfobacteraceae bacterium]